MKTVMLVIAMTIMLAACPVMAESVGVNWTDQYRWHGFKVFDSGYIHTGITTEIQGIDVGAVSHLGDNEQDVKYWDTILGYAVPVGEFNVRAGYSYLIFPGQDVQEMSATVSLPGDIAPRYTIAHVELDDGDSGQLHIFGIDMSIGDPEAVSANLMAEITFNNRVNPFGPAVKDWTHLTTGLAVIIPIGTMTVSPAVFYQHTMEPAINDTIDEGFFAVNITKKF